jgi:hypothetical protein
MLMRMLASLQRIVTSLLPRMRLASAAPTPLDPIERLQQHGGGLGVMLEFARSGW